MIYCSYCNTSNRDGSKFCNECGAPVLGDGGVVCPTCQAKNPLVGNYCLACGATLPGPSQSTLQTVPAVPETPLTPQEIEEELPSLEADVPFFPADDIPLAAPSFESPTPDSSSAFDFTTSPSIEHLAHAAPQDVLLTDEDLSIIEWYDASGSVEDDFTIIDLPVSLPIAPTESDPHPVRTLPQWIDLVEPEVASTAGILPDWLTLQDEPPEPKVILPKVLPSWLFLPESSPRNLPAWLDLEEEIAIEQPFADSLPEATTLHQLPEWLFIEERPAKPPILPAWLFLEEEASPPPTPAPILPAWITMEEPPEEEAVSQSFATLSDGGVSVEAGAMLDTAPELELSAIHYDLLPLAASLERAEVVGSSAEGVAIADTGDDVVPVQNLVRPSESLRPLTRGLFEQTSVPDYESAFHQILQPKTEPVDIPSAPAVNRFRLLSVLLIIVLTIPLLFPMWINVEPGRSASAVFNTIQGLPSSANVLVSFDWGAGSDDEMAPIAGAIVDHLTQRKVKIVAVSLVPEGAKLAQRILDRSVLPNARDYPYGQRVVNLGFLPGDEAAIQAMSSDFAGKYGVDYFETPTTQLPLLREVKSIRNVDMVIVFSDRPENLSKWVTQLSARYPGIRMVAGVSAPLLPWAQPFADGKQLKGIVTGIRGAAQYELQSTTAFDGKPRIGLATLDALSLGSAFIVIAIIVGNLAQLVSAFRRPKGTRDAVIGLRGSQ